MPKYNIIEVDNDYRAYAGSEVMWFPSLEAAHKYCTDESWQGQTYYVDEKVGQIAEE